MLPAARPLQSYERQPGLEQTLGGDPTFAAIMQEVMHERKCQAVKSMYDYVVTDYTTGIIGGATFPAVITIEQGSDFLCTSVSISAFSYSATVATLFPMPSSSATPALGWACRGLTVQITDTRAGRTLTSGEVPIELIGTPAYGVQFIKPMAFRYFMWRNSKIRFDLRCFDNPTPVNAVYRVHYYGIALHGYKFYTPAA